ncbi:MAG: hypothetical protein ACFFB7_03015 [Candidatus Sifarchaeia archaeon]
MKTNPTVDFSCEMAPILSKPDASKEFVCLSAKFTSAESRAIREIVDSTISPFSTISDFLRYCVRIQLDRYSRTDVYDAKTTVYRAMSDDPLDELLERLSSGKPKEKDGRNEMENDVNDTETGCSTKDHCPKKLAHGRECMIEGPHQS